MYTTNIICLIFCFIFVLIDVVRILSFKFNIKDQMRDNLIPVFST